MARPVYQHELSDPDFSWLMTSFQESHPDFIFVDSVSLPAVFVKGDRELEVETKSFSTDQKPDVSLAPEDDPLVFGKTPK